MGYTDEEYPRYYGRISIWDEFGKVDFEHIRNCIREEEQFLDIYKAHQRLAIQANRR